MLSSNNLPIPLEENVQNELLGKGKNITNIPEKNRNIIIERNLRLVAHIATNFKDTNIEFDDLFQVGTMGLLKAVKYYNPSHNTKFSTYSATCIKNQIKAYIGRNSKCKHNISLQERITNKMGEYFVLEDILEDKGQSLETLIVNKLISSDISQKVNKLDKQLKFILYNRIFCPKNDKVSRRIIAEFLGMSDSNVSRLEKKALKKSAQLLKDYKYNVYM